MKNMKKSTMVSIVVVLAFAILLTSATAVVNQTKSSAVEDDAAPKAAKVKKPAQVKGLKKLKDTCKWDGHRNVNSVKISFKKVKGAVGYQILVYQKITPPDSDLQTPILYAMNTKKLPIPSKIWFLDLDIPSKSGHIKRTKKVSLFMARLSLLRC